MASDTRWMNIGPSSRSAIFLKPSQDMTGHAQLQTRELDADRTPHQSACKFGENFGA